MIKKRILAGIFGFYLTLAFLIPQLAYLFCFDLQSVDTITEKFCKDSSAESALKGIIEECHVVADPCDIPVSVYDGIFDKEVIREHIRLSVTAAVKGDKDFKIDTTAMNEALNAKVHQYLKETDDIEDFEDYEADIKAFCDQSLKIYSSYVNLSLFRKVQPFFNSVNKYILIFVLIGIVLLAIGIFFICKFNGTFGESLRDISYSLMASGVFNGIIGYDLLKTKAFDEITISPMYLRDAIRDIAHHAFRSELKIAIFTAGTGFILFVISALLNYDPKKKQAEPYIPSEDPCPISEEAPEEEEAEAN